MLQFLQPIWLWMASAVIVPLIIHLWHVKEGRRLKIGSVSLLDSSTRQRSRNRIPRDWLLLLLRCMLIILLSFLLAGPVWKNNVKSDKERWVLLDQASASAALTDSLRDAGYKIHFFEPGFPVSASPIKSNYNYWNLLSTLPVDNSLIIAPLYLNRFRGIKPQALRKFSWRTPADSAASWIVSAWRSPGDSLQVVTGESSGAATTYLSRTLTASGSEFSIDRDSVRWKASSAVSIDTTVLRVEIAGEEGSIYIKAALEAISAYLNKKIQVTEVSSVSKSGDWLFWLSNKPFPEQQFSNVFRYAGDEPQLQSGWVSMYDGSLDAGEISVNKRNRLSRGAVVWADGTGSPILSMENNAGQRIWNFAGKLEPSWNGLPWSERFPELLMGLMFKSDPGHSEPDKRTIDPALLESKAQKEETLSGDTRDISVIISVSVATLFALERFISWYSSKNRSHAG